MAQTENNPAAKDKTIITPDSIPYKYGIRLGIDISGPITMISDTERKFFRATADARIHNDYFLAAEIGYQYQIYDSPDLKYNSEGYFVTLGGDYDMLGYKPGRNDVIIFGLRYGFSTFNQTVDSFTIGNSYWNNDTYYGNVDPQNAYAHWINLRLGIKVEVLKNFYLGASTGVNFLINDSDLDNFDNLFIPGFGKNNNGKSWTYNYTLMYLIPFN